MYLRALEIQGFKSFPDKTRLNFEKDITAIVGPNGSGKSNISDAILWVMGEQRSKALRGGKMEDVIFGGTEKRSAMGFAQVSLVLDNSGGLLNVDAEEVTITRRYYRNGESEYYVNRESVRLRDITELLMDTGLGRDGYSVIGQGRIAEIVSAKSTDRREIFEEAAGIARYRRRKEEAERKLERTDDNLLRINDKIDELEMQVIPLKEQSETAKRFLVLRDERRGLEISVWMATLDKLHEQAESVTRDYETARCNLDQAQQSLDALYAAADNYSEKMHECDSKLELLRAEQSAEEAEAAGCESDMAVLRTKLAHNEETMQRMESELREQADRAQNIEQQVAAHDERIAAIEEDKNRCQADIQQVLRESEANAAATGEAQRGLTEMVARENAIGEEMARCRTMLSMLEDKGSDLKLRREGIDADIAEGEEKYEAVSRQLRAAEADFAAAKERLDEVNNVITGHKMLMGGREGRVKELSEKLNRLVVDKRSMEGRIHMLSEMEKEFEGMGKAVKTVMRAQERGALRGIHGPVANLISVDERYAMAIETALGAAMQNIVVDSQEAGKAAIEMLKRNDGGRATFLPLASIKPGRLNRVPVGEEGYLGVASELVRFEKTYENIVQNLLGRTVVAESLGDAIRLSRKFDNQLRIVTLDGQLMNAGGSMTGGSTAKNVGILSRANELKQLKEQLVTLTERSEDCQRQLEQASRELDRARYELEVAGSELTEVSERYHRAENAVSQCKLLQRAADENIEALEEEKRGLAARIRECQQQSEQVQEAAGEGEKALEELRRAIGEASEGREEFERRREQLSLRLSELRAAAASLDVERETILRARESLEALLRANSGDAAERRNALEELRRQGQESREELEAKQAQAQVHYERVAAVKKSIEDSKQFRLELEGKRTRSEKAGQEKNRELLELQQICANYERKKQAAEMEESQIVDRLWENYELSRSAAQELRQPVENMAQAQKRIGELKRDIARLGNVNVGAIEEYERVSERYNFLTEQRSDVNKAKRDLEKIIADLTGEMKEIFTTQFKAISESFRDVFLDLFGGGKATLQLEDEENVLDCGIEIKVQPPGKAVTTISLLSGGEKSFVAIALYFAIMKVRPTPFCIMDEIDAALDEANVARYADYMRSMAGKTQFIAITHHRGTMEEADVLYGVTMQEKGVTTVLSIDLEEAERTLA